MWFNSTPFWRRRKGGLAPSFPDINRSSRDKCSNQGASQTDPQDKTPLTSWRLKAMHINALLQYKSSNSPGTRANIASDVMHGKKVGKYRWTHRCNINQALRSKSLKWLKFCKPIPHLKQSHTFTKQYPYPKIPSNHFQFSPATAITKFDPLVQPTWLPLDPT